MSAVFPLNMRHQPSSGYNHNGTYSNMSYESWKGTGEYQNPVGVTSTHIRPLTNNDSGNIFPTGFGLPRPIKHYRKGRVIPVPNIMSVDPSDKSRFIEQNLVNYNLNRSVKSSKSTSLGGGGGGDGLISQLIDNPGGVAFTSSQFSTAFRKENETNKSSLECNDCNGVSVVSSWYPVKSMTEKPNAITNSYPLCCNQEKKALRRVLPTSTNIKKNYYQTHSAYMYNRCQTFGQREFNFLRVGADPLRNEYVAQCVPNTNTEETLPIIIESVLIQLLQTGLIETNVYNEMLQVVFEDMPDFLGALKIILSVPQYSAVVMYLSRKQPINPKGCGKVIYKPNNQQFAHQGAVSSSDRILKLTVDTVTKCAYNMNNQFYKEKTDKCRNVNNMPNKQLCR